MAGTLNVLSVSAEGPAETVASRLAFESEQLAVECESDAGAALARIEAGHVACVLADAGRGEVSELVGRVRDADPHLPVILIFGDDAGEVPDDALATGATDYVRLDDGPAADAALATRIENAAFRYASRDAGRGPEPTPLEAEFDRLETVFAEIGESLYVADECGEYVAVSQATARPTGYEATELLDGGPALIFEEADRERFARAIRDLLAAEDGAVTTVEATMQTKSDETVPVEVTMTLRTDEDGRFLGTVGVLRDVTGPKETERELQEYESIIRAIPDEIAITDTEGNHTRVIPPTGSAVTASGWRPEELKGEPVSMALPRDAVDRGWDLAEEIIATDRTRGTYELDVVTKDGERLPRESHMALLRDDDGSLRGTVSVLRDIEERKAYERELERQNERLERFAEIASHDLRNPLNLADGYLQLVADDCDSEHLGTVEDALDRMEKLVGDTLTWARQGATVEGREPIALGTLAPECWRAIGTEAGRLTVVDDVTVEGDPSRVRQVVENLLRNSVEHGGEDVTVRIGAIDGEGFYVADDGPGIPPDRRDSVFDVGFTTASTGTGFGLAIVGEIVEAHGWEIAVTESDEAGARFEITGADLEP